MYSLTEKLGFTIDSQERIITDHIGFDSHLSHAPKQTVGFFRHIKLPVYIYHDVASCKVRGTVDFFHLGEH
ncbi:hypothetical protein HanRHA438_Chr14g0663961 [Helianthus annuus]|nr:hypothetical protein HanRHA438_Chr14g0663961 [Helianthus annuus]